MTSTRILIVEDDPLLAYDLESVLVRLGHRVCGSASNFESALGLARSEKPDLAIVDLKLAHGTSGLAAASELYHSFGVRSLFLSGNLDDVTERKAAEDCNPIGFLAKPYAVADLAVLLQDVGKVS